MKYIHCYFALCNYFKYYGGLKPYVKTLHVLCNNHEKKFKISDHKGI